VRELLFEVDPYVGFDPLPPCSIGWNLAGDAPLFRELIERVRPRLIIEVGSWLGGSAVTMAQAMKDLELLGEIVCVDSWQGPFTFWDRIRCPDGYRALNLKNGWPQVFYQFLSNIMYHNLQDYITPLPQSCDVAAQVLEMFHIKADMIYIDASHEEDAVTRDLIAYSRLLHANGVIFGDDYYHAGTPVGLAVHRYFGQQVWYAPYQSDDKRFWIHGGLA